MRRLNILQVNSGRIWSGAEVHMEDLSKKLQEKGHYVLIACTKNRVVEKKLADSSLPLRYIPGRWGKTSALLKLIEEEDIDIVHAHSGRDFLACAIAAKLANKAKLVITRHSLTPMRKRITNFLIKGWTDKFIAVSQAVFSIVKERDKIKEEKISLIHNGINLAKHSLQSRTSKLREDYHIPVDINLIGCVGRLDEVKGQVDLLHSFPIILDAFPNTKLVLVGEDLTGGGERRKIKNAITKLGLDDKVILTGFLAGMPEVMADLDVFVLSSREEPFGLVVLEAMAQEIPIVATRVGGIPEIVVDGESGILVESENPSQLAEAIIYLLENKEIAKKIAQCGRKRLEAEFNLDLMIEKTEKVYFEILGRS